MCVEIQTCVGLLSLVNYMSEESHDGFSPYVSLEGLLSPPSSCSPRSAFVISAVD